MEELLKIKKKIDIERWFKKNASKSIVTLTDDLKIDVQGQILINFDVTELPSFINIKSCYSFNMLNAKSNKGFPLKCKLINVHNLKVFRPKGFRGIFTNTKHNREMHPDGQTTSGKYEEYLAKYPKEEEWKSC